MREVVASRLKLQWTRYVLVFVVVAVCSGFTSAALGLSSTLNAAITADVSAQFKNAGAVVVPPQGSYDSIESTDAQLASIAGLEGVRSAWVQELGYAAVGTPGHVENTNSAQLSTLPQEHSLLPTEVLEGSFPSSDRELMLSTRQAENLGVHPGDRVELALPAEYAPSNGQDSAPSLTFTVSGVTESGRTGAVPDAWLTQKGLTAVTGAQPNTPHVSQAIQLATAGSLTDAQLSTLSDQVGRILGGGTGQQPQLRVITPEQAATEFLQQISSGQNVLTIFLLAFAGLAVLVALLVVTNTLSVLTAQRARELALLRCVGATGRQVRRAVFAEGLVIGVIGGALGVGAVWALAAVLNLLGLNGGMELVVTPRDLLAGLITGVVLTVLASFGPARRAHGASPLDGLRGSRAADGMPPVRTTIGAIALVGGAAALVFAAYAHIPGLGVLGGLASFLGVVLTARVYLPGLVRVVGRVLPGGLPSRLAAVNAGRYPARTSTTATALLIGVLLVATVLTGQYTARQSLLADLDASKPVDISVPASAGPLSDSEVQRLEGLNGVVGVERTDPASADGAVAQIDAAQGLNNDAAASLRTAVADVLGVAPDQLGGALLEKATYVSILEIMLTVTLGLLAAAVVVSVLGVASTMSLSVLERVRENSLLRALGLTRRQLGSMIRRESLVISLVATAVGLVVGWAFGTLGVMSLSTEDMSIQPVVPWVGFVAILAGAVVVAILAAAAPVRRATRVTPVEGMARVD